MTALNLVPAYVRDKIERCETYIREDLCLIPYAEANGWTVTFPNDNWEESAIFFSNDIHIWWSHYWRAKHSDEPSGLSSRTYHTLQEALDNNV